ncbi:MAG: 50S ribosomal protein L15 [Bacteroidia bacterium]|nr:50S ribosomal protein L15 [Bacteroidia bacterium]
MKLHTLAPAPNSVRNRKRVGRGQGSGRGGTSTKGHKGHQSRSGYKYKPGFEGGQMPLQRRLPKFGFKNPFRVEYYPLNLDLISKLLEADPSITKIDHELLVKKGIISKPTTKVKVLGRGQLTKAIIIQVDKFSESAKEIITSAGGEAIEC